MALLTTKQVAQKLKYTAEHIRRLIRDGELKAIVMGNQYFVESEDAKNVKRKRRPNSKSK